MEILGKDWPNQHELKADGIGAPALKKILSFCAGQVSSYVHAFFYKPLKFITPWMLEKCTEITKLLLNSVPALWSTLMASSPNHCQHWVCKWVRMTSNLACLNVRGHRDPSKCAHLLGELKLLCWCCCSAGDSFH